MRDSIIGFGRLAAVMLFAASAVMVSPQIAAEGHGDAKGGDTPYLAMDAVIVNLVGRKHYLRVDIQLKADQPANLEKLKKHIPLFRHELIMLMSNRDPEVLADPAEREHLRKESLEALKHALKATTGSGKALKDVYFTDFMMQ